MEYTKELRNTDVGLLTTANIQYLQGIGLINGDGHILFKLIDRSSFNRPIQLWNMFCLIKDDIEDTLGIYELNSVVDVMRNGETGGDKKYPKVIDFIQKGSQLVVEAIRKSNNKSKSKKDDFSFDD